VDDAGLDNDGGLENDGRKMKDWTMTYWTLTNKICEILCVLSKCHAVIKESVLHKQFAIAIADKQLNSATAETTRDADVRSHSLSL